MIFETTHFTATQDYSNAFLDIALNSKFVWEYGTALYFSQDSKMSLKLLSKAELMGLHPESLLSR